MCGIAAVVSFAGEGPSPQVLERMAASLAHRGPDDRGIEIYGPVGLAFRRLAILDLSAAGHQPMESEDGTLSLVFNGEIYNYLELKQQLVRLGHHFRSRTDTEVILAAYRQWGPDCAARFNGMWALVLYDKQQRRLFISRDRFGVKPLYLYRTPRVLVLASEIKGILASGLHPTAGTNWRSAAKFLVRGHLDDSSETFYEGIGQVAPGSIVEADLAGGWRERTFWSLDGCARTADDKPPTEAFRELFVDAVRLRMRSDVPVGVCLSGGIDSNAILAAMAQQTPASAATLQAFSYIPEQFKEAHFVVDSVRRNRAELNALDVTPAQLWDVLPTALWHYDEPVHSPSALINFELMRLARKRGVSVVLNGQGADEVNAGYPTFFRVHWSDFIRRGRLMAAWREMSEYARGHRVSARGVIGSALAHSTLATLEDLPGYLRMAARRRARRLGRDPWFSGELLRELPLGELGDPSMDLQGLLRYAVERRPLPLYLRVEDRSSMAHSVEARLPFLDYRLVSLAFSLGAEWKLRGPWNKYIVRQACRGLISDALCNRIEKMGLPTPSAQWFRGAWYEPTRDLLASRALRQCGALNIAEIEKNLARHRRGELDASSRLFRVVQLATWLQATPGQTAARHGVRVSTVPPASVTAPV